MPVRAAIRFRREHLHPDYLRFEGGIVGQVFALANSVAPEGSAARSGSQPSVRRAFLPLGGFRRLRSAIPRYFHQWLKGILGRLAQNVRSLDDCGGLVWCIDRNDNAGI